MSASKKARTGAGKNEIATDAPTQSKKRKLEPEVTNTKRQKKESPAASLAKTEPEKKQKKEKKEKTEVSGEGSTVAKKTNKKKKQKKPKPPPKPTSVKPGMSEAEIMSLAMGRKNLMYYNQLISESAKRKQSGFAVKLFKQLQGQGLTADVFTYSCVINACIRAGNVELARKFFDEMAEKQVKPNSVTYTTLIKGYTEVSYDLNPAWKLINRMKSDGVEPNDRTYTTLLRGALHAGDWGKGRAAFQEVLKLQEKEKNLRERVGTLTVYLKLLAQHAKLDEVPQRLKELDSCIIQLSKEQSEKSENAEKSGKSEKSEGDAMDTSEDGKKKAKKGKKEDESEGEKAEEEDEEDKGGKKAKKQRAFTVRATVYLELALAMALEGKKEEGLEILKRVDSVEDVTPSEKQQKEDLVKFLSSKKKVTKTKGLTEAQNVIFFDDKNSQNKPIPAISSVWKNHGKPVFLEICSGTGEWVVNRCKKETDKNWLALEQRYDRVHQIWAKSVVHSVGNLGILAGEATAIVGKHLEKDSVDKIYVNFPTPQIEENSSLFTPKFVEDVHKVMKTGGTITILTDDGSFAALITKQFLKSQKKAGFAKIESDEENRRENSGSFFDELWEARGRTERHFCVFKKLAL